VSWSPVLLALVAAPVLAQSLIPYDLAISSDASQIYFISRLSLAGSPASSSNYNIYKYSQGAVELFHAVSYGELPAGGPLSNVVNVSLAASADGSMLATSFVDSYSPGGPCDPDVILEHLCQYGTNYSGQLFSTSGEKTYTRGPILSRNGRFIYACNPACLLYDLTLGTSQTVPLAVASIADNGTVCGGVSGNPAIWTSQSGVEAITQLAQSLSSVTISGGLIDSTGSHVLVYATNLNLALTLPYIVDISSGQVNMLPAGYQFLQFSDSGSIMALLGKDTASMTQVFLANVDGTNLQQVTAEPSGIGSAVISGDGSVVIAANGYGEVLRFDVAPGTRQVLFETGPQDLGGAYYLIGPAFPPPGSQDFEGGSPGSMIVLTGIALAKQSAVVPPESALPHSLAGLQVLIDGAPAPLIKVDPGAIRLQLPWELPTGVHYLQVSRPFNSPFAPAAQLMFQALPLDPHFLAVDLYDEPGRPSTLAIHQDWTPITGANPAQEGEILHFFATGFGIITGSVVTGVPAPANPRFPVQNAINLGPRSPTDVTPDCFSDGTTTFNLLFAGLAPGTVGIYQLDMQLSHLDPAQSSVTLYCRDSSSSAFTYVTFPVQPATQ
jgi:uncharacterized protein (TIGR03437 family)